VKGVGIRVEREKFPEEQIEVEIPLLQKLGKKGGEIDRLGGRLVRVG